MTIKYRGDFFTYHSWFKAALGSENIILRNISALECLDLFSGPPHEKIIDVYALKKGKTANVNYFLVKSFEDIEICRIRGLRCASLAHTANDMLSQWTKWKNSERRALCTALANFYCSNGDSFSGLRISTENWPEFQVIKDWVISNYSTAKYSKKDDK